MKSSSEGCNFAVVAAIIITGIEITICIFVGVKSKDPTHPFFYMQKMNFAFFISIAVLLIVTGLNLIPMIAFIVNCENVPYPIVRFLFSRLIVTVLMSCFHLTASICLFMLFLILETKSDNYFSIRDYKIDGNVQGFIDSVQSTLICCGKYHGVRDWNGSVPSSCCQARTCPKYRQNWPCFPMLKYTLGSPMLVSFIAILVNVCCTFFCLWAKYKQLHFDFLSLYEEQKPMLAPPVHPTPSVHPRASPCYMTESDLGSRPYSEFKLLEANKDRHRRKASYEYDRFFSDRALLDARRGSGYRKFGAPTYRGCDSAVSKRVSFSLPPDRTRKLSDSAKHDVSEVLSRNLHGVMEGCITQKCLERMKGSDSELKEGPDVAAALDGGDELPPAVIPEEKQPTAAGKAEEPEKCSEQPKKKFQKPHHKEVKPKSDKAAVEADTKQKRPTSPIQALKGRLKKRKEKKEALRQSAEEGSKPDAMGQ